VIKNSRWGRGFSEFRIEKSHLLAKRDACYNPQYRSTGRAPAVPRGESMKRYQKFPTAFVLGCSCLVFLTIPAYGYTDPNTVGLISQILTPLLITVGACLTFLRKSLGDALAGLSRRLRRRSDG
jgi:hypothetical protein